MANLYAALHSADSGRKWHVEFNGELIVKDSKDPECDAARALPGDRMRWQAAAQEEEQPRRGHAPGLSISERSLYCELALTG
jgi:hypothetical protein